MTVKIEPLSRFKPVSSVLPSQVHGRDILDYCQRVSGEVWTGYIDEKLICCWGLVPPSVFSNTAYLWMYFNIAEPSHADLFVFIRRSQIEVQKMLCRYEFIRGDCEVNNHKAIRWLRWLGAEFAPPDGALRPFVIRRPHG